MRLTTFLGLLLLTTYALCNTIEVTWNVGVHPNNTINVGDTIMWMTTDGLQHTVTSDDRTLLVSPTIQAGTSVDRFQHTFTDTGTFNYFCTVHGALLMSGTVIVETPGGGNQTNITALPILPVLECVDQNGDGSITAFFGYYNPNEENVTIPLGALNNVAGGDLPVETFEAGRQTRVFSATGDAASNITWAITSGGVQNMAVATNRSRSCSVSDVAPPGEVIPLLNCTVVQGNSYTAFLSYINTGFEPIELPDGESNQVFFVSPTENVVGFPIITSFAPGEGVAFNVTMPLNTVMTWQVINDYTGTSRSVRVTSNSPSCSPCSQPVV